MRPLPEISTSFQHATMERNASLGHSRASSVASSSSASAPMSPTFSVRSHSRWPSASSSLATSPDSPINAKSSLDDLVEEPAEFDGDAFHSDAPPSREEFCICDTVLCKHQQTVYAPLPTPPPSSPEWLPGDDFMDFVEPMKPLKSQRSSEMSVGSITSRFSHRWPSISSRWRDRRATRSVSSPTVRSAPPSRTASLKHSIKQSLSSHLEPHATMLLFAPLDRVVGNSQPTPDSPTLPQSIDWSLHEEPQDPIDRKELSSTPLLPPLLTDARANREESFQSPLQSPSVASPKSAAAVSELSFPSPVMAGPYTPPLSTKPSVGSMYRAYSDHFCAPNLDVPDSGCLEELEYLTLKLGHANIRVLPEPYMPEKCDEESCDRLLMDWGTARLNYMNQSYAVSEHYGPTSSTYKLNSKKWELIDRQWQTNVDRARAEAEAIGESPRQDTLAVPVAASQMPSLPFDPNNPEKFPSTAEHGIVGPMVQYVKPQRTPSKKKNFLKLLLEPAALLGSRSLNSSRS